MRELALRVGDRHELELRGPGGAGYSWETKVEGPEGVVEIRRRSSGAAPEADPGGPPPPNASLAELIEIDAVGAGRVRVSLALRRAWEDAEPLEHDELEIVVSG